MKTVKDLLREKGSSTWSVSPDASVFEAIQLMADKNVGSVLVMKDDHLVGMITERDYARKLILVGRSSKDTPVADVMTTEVAFVNPSDSVHGCMQLMTDKRFRHLPVMKDGELLGLVSIGDLVKAVIEEQQYTIEQLENYITGQ